MLELLTLLFLAQIFILHHRINRMADTLEGYLNSRRPGLRSLAHSMDFEKDPQGSLESRL